MAWKRIPVHTYTYARYVYIPAVLSKNVKTTAEGKAEPRFRFFVCTWSTPYAGFGSRPARADSSECGLKLKKKKKEKKKQVPNNDENKPRKSRLIT